MKTDISIELSPVFYDDPPYAIVSVDNTILFNDSLHEDHNILYNGDLVDGDHKIRVEFNNKKDDDCDIDRGLDKAIIVKNVHFFGIGGENIRNKGVYTPIYPTQYALDHTTERTPQTYGYMGWNGIWELTFSVPIFTWIHNVEQLGWIYPN